WRQGFGRGGRIGAMDSLLFAAIFAGGFDGDRFRGRVDRVAETPVCRWSGDQDGVPNGGPDRFVAGPGGKVRPDQRHERVVPYSRSGPVRGGDEEPGESSGPRWPDRDERIHAARIDADELDAGAEPLRDGKRRGGGGIADRGNPCIV